LEEQSEILGKSSLDIVSQQSAAIQQSSRHKTPQYDRRGCHFPHFGAIQSQLRQTKLQQQMLNKSPIRLPKTANDSALARTQKNGKQAFGIYK
jgi:hypothetical protein